MSKTILVPVDGSEHSKKALEFAADLCARLDGGKLSLLHVAQSLPHDRTLVLGGAAISVRASPDELEEVGRKVIDAAREIAAEHGCTQVDASSELGDPAAKIVERAKAINADMIVMGSRGVSDLKGLVMGSVSHKVMHLAPCTCVSVR